MRLQISKHERSYITNELRYKPAGRTITGYQFAGLPAGQEAFAANFGNEEQASWRLLRVIDGLQHDWTGDYASIDDLQAALEDELFTVYLR